MRRTNQIIALLLAMLYSLPGQALDPKLTFYQYDFAGPGDFIDLPEVIFDIVEDDNGYLWLATARGLIRLDGIQASSFRTAEYPALQSNRPTRLLVDSNGRLFVASDRGLSVYSDGEFRILASHDQPAERFRAMAEIEDGSIWLGSDNGLFRTDGEQISAVELPIDVGKVGSMLRLGDVLYVGALGRILEIKNRNVRQFELPEDMQGTQIEDLDFHQGHIWGATHRGLVRMENNTVVRVDEPELAGLAMQALLSDRDNNLWFGGPDAVGRFYPDGRIELPQMLHADMGMGPQLTSLFEDSAGRVWHTSRLFGMEVVSDSPALRYSYTEGLLSPNIHALTDDGEGTTFIATDAGISTLADGQLATLVEMDVLPGQFISTMIADGNRLTVAIGTEIRQFDLDARQWLAEKTIELPAAINVLGKAALSGYWAGTDDGLYRIENGEPIREVATSGTRINSLIVESSGVLLLGTRGGVVRFQEGNVIPAHELTLATSAVISFAELESGDIAALTAEQGILLRRDGRWHTIDESDGIPPETLIDIEAQGNFLWLVTSSGVFGVTVEDAGSIRANPVVTTPRYRSIHTNYCCRGAGEAAALRVDGQLIVSTTDGVLTIPDSIVSQDVPAPAPYVASARIGDYEWTPGTQKLELPAADTQLVVDVSAIQLTGGDQVIFRYRVDGFIDDWVETGTTRQIVLTSLPAGSFELEVQASAAPGVWSAESAKLHFSRSPSLTDSIWFQSLLALCAVAIALLLFRLRLLQLDRRRLALEKEIGERTEKLRNVNIQLEDANRELVRSSFTDPLTGLLNRRYFDDKNFAEEAQGRIAEQGVLAVIDIDFFKRVNDAYGHSAGDEILRQFAAVLADTKRHDDLLARWGGEEFILFAESPKDNPEIILARIVDAVRRHTFRLPDKKRISLTCSVGAVQYPIWPGESFDERLPVWMEVADTALYAVKMNGRDSWAMVSAGETELVSAASARQHLSGARVKEFIENDWLSWKAGRADISLSLFDTITRLQVLKPRR